MIASLITTCYLRCFLSAVADQGFPRGGANPREPIIWHNFAENCTGGVPQCMLGYTLPGRHHPQQTPPWADPSGRHPTLGRHLPADGYCSGWYANAYLLKKYNLLKNREQFEAV